ncbi:TPA: DUF4263 domain-containing protein [Aeromonas hydrophila]|nr:DUF4263 domain-containing protein [Aeromonas hydrophila]
MGWLHIHNRESVVMSVDHSYVIANDGTSDVRVNISGLDADERNKEELAAHLYATCSKTGTSKFTCSLSIDQLSGLYAFLGQYEMIKEQSKRKSGTFVQVAKGNEELIAILQASNHEQVIPALRAVVKENLSDDDLNTILGRREAWDKFNQMLNDDPPHTEPEYQQFLEQNDWILGYGLRYCYLSILQRECRVSGTDLDGGNSVISDFLLSDTRFTKLVELKRPDTPLFKNKQNRSESWQLSDDLTHAVSQILSQKAQWQIESTGNCFTGDGKRITEKTHDVDCILVIGTSGQFAGDNKEAEIKTSTFELYRRNMRNIEIILYDELRERAKFIVDGSNKAIQADASGAADL